MKLNYKASNIARAERETGLSFFDTISSLSNGVPSINSLMFLCAAGGATEDEFDAIFEKGLSEVMIVIIGGINDAGFLGAKIDTTELCQTMEAAKKATKTSPSTGAPAKA